MYVLSLGLKENIDFGSSRCFRFTYRSLQQPPALVILFHRGGVVLLTPTNLIWFQDSDSERVGACGQRSSEKTPGKQAQETRLSTHYRGRYSCFVLKGTPGLYQDSRVLELPIPKEEELRATIEESPLTRAVDV